jgi:hypothetical protein
VALPGAALHCVVRPKTLSTTVFGTGQDPTDKQK